VLGLWSSVSHADEVDAAREHFKRGVQAFEAGDHAGALAAFQAADEAHHAPAISYNMARALESLGRIHAALGRYEAYVAEAGHTGEFVSAATVAIAQIKSRSTTLRVETNPPGAQVSVDGEPLAESSPTSVWLPRGAHRVQIRLGDWTEARAVDVPGGGSSSVLSFVRSAPSPTKSAAPKVRRDKSRSTARAAKVKPELDGLIGGAGLSISGYQFIGETTERDENAKTESDSTAKGLVFGLTFEAGWALSSRLGLMLRGSGGIGSSRGQLAAVGAAGPVLTYRIGRDWWLGGGIVVGGSRADADATRTPVASASSGRSNTGITYNTDFAVGPTLELSYALGQNQSGQWLVSLQPGVLLTTSGENTNAFMPLVIGYRWF
jgi:hypothetical protein